MKVVIEFNDFDRAEDFIAALMSYVVIVGENGYDYMIEGYEYTQDGEAILAVRASEYDESDLGDFSNDE